MKNKLGLSCAKLRAPKAHCLLPAWAGQEINFPGGWGWVEVAGLVENKANSARPAKLKLATSWGWDELGNKNILKPYNI